MSTTEDTPTRPDQDLDAIIVGTGLLFDWLQTHPEIGEVRRAPYQEDEIALRFSVWVWSPEELAAAVRVLKDGAPLGAVRKVQTDYDVKVTRMFGGVQLAVCSLRSTVCERKVVGTKQVETFDTNAPKIMVEQEIVEWDCKPLLGLPEG
jgi:hypothetical protein